jgi:hypothetical protein
MKTMFSRRLLLAGALAALIGASVSGPGARPALAHEAKCPMCKLDVVQDTDKLDNEVALKSGRKRIEYRCVYCALSDAKSYTGDITILAPSELKGKPVVLSRKEGKWSVAPETAVFVGEKVDHRSCQVGYRALTTQDAFAKWVQANQALLKEAKPLSLAQMLEVAAPAK